MELSNEFDVAAPIDDAWKVLTDLETIAPCMPGAQLTEVEGDDYRGTVKIKVGPITAKFKGTASFVEQDVENHRAVLRAKGKDTGGKGNADATITAQLSPAGTGTHVVITTDLNISGRVAQFGRGALADVSSKLLGQFVDCLESNVLGGDGASTDTAGSEPAASGAETGAVTAATEEAAVGADPHVSATPSAGPAELGPKPASSVSPGGSGTRRIDSPEAAPVDLVQTAGTDVAKRVIPVVLVVVVVIWLLRRRGR
jgi:carbon monoxide dehydrogenase subunit G